MNEVGLKDQCFGVEVELTGITREQAAQALRIILGQSLAVGMTTTTAGMCGMVREKNGG